MDDLEPTLTMIIPTLGRPSLWRTLDQFESINDITEVIVVFEMGYYNKPELKEKISAYKKVRFIEGSKPGVSANLNHGLELLRTNYVGFFSDDDLLIATDFKNEINFLKSHQVDLLFGASKMNKIFKRITVRPKIAIVRPSQILETPWWLPSPYYLSLINVIASSRVKDYRFKEDLKGYEDIEWLLRLQASGFKFKQNFTLRSFININEIRNSKRDDADLRNNVFNHLKTLDKTWAQKYIVNISPRNHILVSNFIEIAKISREKRYYLGQHRFLHDLGVGLVQMIFSVLLRITVRVFKRFD